VSIDSALLIFIIVISYILILIILKHFFSYGAKIKSAKFNNCCPDCSLALRRVKRIFKDRVLNQITFRIFNHKRYICENCGWLGLRWEKKYNPN